MPTYKFKSNNLEIDFENSYEYQYVIISYKLILNNYSYDVITKQEKIQCLNLCHIIILNVNINENYIFTWNFVNGNKNSKLLKINESKNK